MSSCKYVKFYHGYCKDQRKRSGHYSQVQDGKPSELQIARFGWIYHPIENGWKILPFKSHILNGREFHPNAISVVLDGLNIQLHLTKLKWYFMHACTLCASFRINCIQVYKDLHFVHVYKYILAEVMTILPERGHSFSINKWMNSCRVVKNYLCLEGKS